MIAKARKKLLRLAAAMVLFSLFPLSSGQAAMDALGGSVIQATPYDNRISAAGVFSLDTADPQALRSSDELFLRAKSIRYVEDAPGQDYWQTPQQTESRWAGDCEDKALWLFAQLKMNGHRNVRLVVGRFRSVSGGYHVWVTMADDRGNVWILDPTAQKKIWKASDFMEGFYRPLYSFDGINRYRHTA